MEFLSDHQRWSESLDWDTHMDRRTAQRGKTNSRGGLIVLLGALAALGPFSIDTYLPAFATMAVDFHTDVGQIGLSLSSYFLGICLGQLAYGPLLDRFGRRTPLLWGLGLYAVASLLCALAPGVVALVALRFLQALGGCAGMVAGRALVRDLFPDDAADVFSSLMLVMGIAPVIAPTVGAVLTEAFGWRAIFGFLAVVSVAIWWAIVARLPTVAGPDPTRSLHPVRVGRAYLKIFAEREFLAWGLSGSLVSGGLFAYLAGCPVVFMEVLSLSSKAFGWVFAINALGLMAASQLNRRLLRSASPEAITRVVLWSQAGTGLLLLGSAALAFAPGIYAGAFLFLSGLGFAFPNTSALAMRPFGEQAGVASALVGSLGMACGALSSGLVSLIPGISAMPMAVGMAVSAILSVVVLELYRR